jgi:alpha-D-ribose 1-methylphosphonate 5-triphosphate synthase subunit PhnH
MRKRHFLYLWFVLVLGGLFVYVTWVGSTPKPPVLVLDGTAAQAKLSTFNQALQAAYQQTQATGHVGHVSLSLTDADATVLLDQKEKEAALDRWVVHFEDGGQAEVWATSTALDLTLHHNYQVFFVYRLDSLDNRAIAEVVAINMSGIELPGAAVEAAAAKTSAPGVEFPPGVVLSVSSREGVMTLVATTVKVTG